MTRMPAKHVKGISLTPELHSWVDQLVSSGEYGSASEVVREALRGLKYDRDRRAAELAEIRARIGRALDSLDRGEHAEGTVEDVFARTLGNAEARARKAS